MLAALAETEASPAHAPALAARRLETLLALFKEAGVARARLVETPLAERPDATGGTIELNVLEPDRPRRSRSSRRCADSAARWSVSEPRSRRGCRRRLASGPRWPSAAKAGMAGWRGLMTSVVLGLLVAAGACRPVNPNEDTRIEAEIKARLVAEKFANLTRLGVLSTRRGRLPERHRRVGRREGARRGALPERAGRGARRQHARGPDRVGPHPPPGSPGPRRERGPDRPTRPAAGSNTGTDGAPRDVAALRHVLKAMPRALKNLDIILGLAVIPVQLVSSPPRARRAWASISSTRNAAPGSRCGSSAPSTESSRARRR